MDGRSTQNAERQPYECLLCRDELGKMVKKEMPAELYPKAKGPVYQDFWQECECAERLKVKKMFAFSEITREMRQMGFDGFELQGRPTCVAAAYQAARNYLEHYENRHEGRQNSIYLGGNPGSGKTHLLMSIANALIGQGVQVLYFPFVEGLDELKSEIREQTGAYQKKLEQLQRTPVLFIDDLFKSKKGKEPSDYEIKFIFSVVNYRYMNHLPILVSSELTIEKVVFWDHAIGSRIFEMCADYLVHMLDGENLNYRLPPGFVIE